METQRSSDLAHFAGTFAIGGDLSVCRLGYGAMRITGAGIWGPPSDRGSAVSVVKKAVDLGMNLIDTADSYGPYVSEEIIAEALSPYPRHVVVTTKTGYERSGPNAWAPNARPEHIRSSCEGSLRRLKLSRIALYQLHCVDPKVPIEDSLGALSDLQKEGKIHHIGVSNVTLAQFRRACDLAKIVSVQNRFNMDDQGSADVLKECERRGIAFMPWEPLASGKTARLQAVRSSGKANGSGAKGEAATPAQIAIAWLLAHSPVMLPIPGTASADHLEENARVASLGLNPQALAKRAAGI